MREPSPRRSGVLSAVCSLAVGGVVLWGAAAIFRACDPRPITADGVIIELTAARICVQIEDRTEPACAERRYGVSIEHGLEVGDCVRIAELPPSSMGAVRRRAC